MSNTTSDHVRTEPAETRPAPAPANDGTIDLALLRWHEARMASSAAEDTEGLDRAITDYLVALALFAQPHQRGLMSLCGP
jgi:hypothetical protein